MLSNEEIKVRRYTIGASDVPKLMNFDNKGAKDLWRFKVGLDDHVELDNKYILFGNLTEETSLLYYFKTVKESDYTLNERVEHKYIKNFISSTDGLINDVPVENKGKVSHGYDSLQEPERNHYIQVMAQLSCTGGDKGIIIYNRADEQDYEMPLLYDPTDKQKVFTIKRDKDLINEIENRVNYMLLMMKHKIEPSEDTYLKYLKTRRKIK